jgi:aromatic-L-amino-acid decarboxylase
VVPFRLRDGGDDANLRLLAKINADGRIFISSTRIAGRVTLRLCILSHRTHREHVSQAVAIIHRAAEPRSPDEDSAPGRPGWR